MLFEAAICYLMFYFTILNNCMAFECKILWHSKIYLSLEQSIWVRKYTGFFGETTRLNYFKKYRNMLKSKKKKWKLV